MSEAADSAHVRIILADYAVADPNNGKITIVGGGISVVMPDPTGAGQTLASSVCAIASFDPRFIGESPAVELPLEKQDGKLFELPTPAVGPSGPIQHLRGGTANRLKPTVLPG